MATEDQEAKFDEILKNFNELETIESWRNAFSGSRERLNAAIRKHLAVFVPAVSRGAGYPTVNPEEEQRTLQYLFLPLERFLCDDADPESVYQRLREGDTPPALCGRVFRMGEPTYSCKDCGKDQTCVMCVTCFENSAHKKHRYRMSTSGGGGYCDCGDAEAWKSDPVCQIHCRGGQSSQSSTDPASTSSGAGLDPVSSSSDSSLDYRALENLPEDLRNRACSLFEVMMRYAVEMILWKDPLALPPSLQADLTTRTPTYCTVLYNDEIHSYDQVIKAVVKAVDCDQAAAGDVATAVDREGRQIVKMGRHSECEAVRRTVEQQTSRNNQTPLKVVLHHIDVYSHQRFAIRVFSWLHDVIRQSEGLRLVFAALSLDDSFVTTRHRDIMASAGLGKQAAGRNVPEKTSSDTTVGGKVGESGEKPATKSASQTKIGEVPSPPKLILRNKNMPQPLPPATGTLVKHAVDANTAAKTPSFMETLMLSDIQLWKSARITSRQLLMGAVLMDGTSKRKFAALFVRLYPKLMAEFVKDDHDHSVSVTSESIQVFTVPSIARWLVMEHDCFAIIVNTFSKLTKVFTTGENPLKRYSFERQEKNSLFRRAIYVLIDLRYVMFAPLVQPGDWTDKLRTRFHAGFLALLNVLKRMQGMDCIVRQTGQHVEFEPEWEGAFNLQIRLSDTLAIILDWCASDPSVLTEAYKATLEAIGEVTSPAAEASIAAETARNTVRRETVLAVLTGATATVVAAATAPQGGVPVGNNMEATTLQAAERAAAAASQAASTASGNRFESCTVDGITVDCIRYDMGTQPVSVHHPVSRLLAGLCVRYNKIGLALDQLHTTLWRKYGASSYTALAQEMMEPSLRAIVLAAQCNAGLWRRNGYALQNQVFFYQCVKCRSQMFDKDVLMLQTCSVLMDSPDSFLISLIHKFGLVKWTRDDYDTDLTQEDSAKQTITLAEHLLKLLIVLLCERYVDGVGEVSALDIAKREVVHQLCIQPMSHSELTKALGDDPYRENCVDEVIMEVAVLKQMGEGGGLGGSAKRMFEVKPVYFSLYTPYFYHYSRSEQVKSEEAERKRRKNLNKSTVLSCPDLPKFTGIYRGITRILMSDIMKHMFKLVLLRSMAKWSKSWSEAQLDMVLFLLDIGLNEQKCDPRFDFLERITSCGVVTQLEQLVGHPNTARPGGPREFIQHLLRKCASLRSTGGRTGSGSAEAADDVNMEDESRRLDQERAKKLVEANRRREKIMAKMATAQRRFIRENQDLFDSTPMEIPVDNQMAEEETVVTVEKPVCVGARRSVGVGGGLRQTCILCQEEQEVTRADRAMVFCAYIQRSSILSRRRVNRRTPPRERPNNRYQSPVVGSPPDRQRIGGLRSRLISPSEGSGELDPPAAKRGTSQQSTTSELSPVAASLFADCDLPLGSFVNTCGHCMHADCWQRFYTALLERETRRGARYRIPPSSFDMSRGEFLCPLCEMISNTVLPIVPQLCSLVEENTAVQQHNIVNDELSLDDWLEGIENTVVQSIKKRRKEEDEEATSMFDESFLFVPCPLSSVTRMMTESVAKNFQALFYYVTDDGGMMNVGEGGLFSDDMIDMLRKFATDGFATSLGTLPDENDSRVPVSVWSLCAYTIRAAENYLKLGHCWGGGPNQDGSFVPFIEGALFGALSSRQAECLGALVRLAAVMGTVTAATVVRQHCVMILSALLGDSKSLSYDSPSITSVDLFQVLVILCLSLPTLYVEDDGEGVQNDATESTAGVTKASKKDSSSVHHIATGHLNDSHALRLVYAAHLVQCITGCDISQLICTNMVTDSDETDALYGEACRFLPLFLDIRSRAGVPVSKQLSPVKVLRAVREHSRPFLRCAALFFHYLTAAPAPLELFENRNPADVEGVDEFVILCQYLGMSPDIPAELSQSPRLSQHMDAWCSKASTVCDAAVYNARLARMLGGGSEGADTNAFRLISLPDDYSELINESSMFSCPRSTTGDDSQSPALCLVCGEIVCSQSYCCVTTLEDQSTIGAATAHARQCGAGTGVFLRVRDCQVLLLDSGSWESTSGAGSNRGCFVAPPYLDAYGETDEGLRRGDALQLCTARYERLQRLWLSHGVAEEVVHVLESNSGLLTFDWNQL